MVTSNDDHGRREQERAEVERGAERGEWERSGEDPEIGTRDVDEENRLHIRRAIPDDPDEGRIGIGDDPD
jgi:hypothetical protein